MRTTKSFTLMLAFSLALVLLNAIPAAWSQEVTAAVVGTVSDPSGAPIKGATVTARDVERGTAWTAETNGTGDFTILRLPIGTYTAEATAPGFEKAAYPRFTLVLNQTARLEFKMKVGQVSETIEVTGAAPILQTQDAQVGTVINNVVSENVPLLTRNYGELTLLTPGAVSTNPAAFTSGQNTFQVGRPYINGNREQTSNYILDGIDNNQHDNNEVAYSPSPDAIEEFNLITQNPSAEFGNFLGGILNVSFKSGTNSFHGSAFEFLRNDALNANTWYNPSGTPKGSLRFNQFAATFGGPFIKNRLFFFVTFEGTAISPSPACQLYAPQAGVDPTLRAPIPNNNLPAAGLTLSSIASSIVNSPLYPSPNVTGTNLLNYSQRVLNSADQGDAKIDWTPNE